MHRTTSLAALLVLAVVSRAHPAHSCSCVRPTVKRVFLPRSGSQGFPTDGILRVFVTGGLPEELRKRLADEYRLRGPDGKLVLLASQLVGTRLDLRPHKPLEPRSRYVLEQVFAFAPSGQRITDTDRWRLAWQRQRRGTARPRIRRAWFPVLAFRTGAGPATRKPPRPRVRQAEVHFAYGGGDCGPGTSLTVGYTIPAGLEPTDLVELWVKGRGLVSTFLPGRRPDNRPGYRVYVGDMLCTPDKVHLGFNGPFQVRLRLRSINDQLSPGSPWKRARAQQLPRPIRGGPHRTPAMPAAVERWFADPLVKGRAKKSAGPAGCAHGLRTTARLALSPTGASTGYEAVGSASWHRGRVETVVGEKGRAALVSCSPGKPAARTRLRGSAGYGVMLRSGPALYVAGVFHPPGPKGGRRRVAGIRVTRHAPGGKPLWTRELRGPGGVSNTKPRLVLGDSGLLVVWEHWPDYGGDHRLHWALLEAGTGKVIHQRKKPGPALGSDAHPGLAHLAGRYYVIFTGTAGNRHPAPMPDLLVLDARGRELERKPLDLPHAGPNFDLVAGTGQLATVFSTARGPQRGLVRWALLAPDGKVVAGPVTVSRGVGRGNRKPRIAARGELFAVAWEVYPGRMLYAAVVDRRGAVSPPLELAPDLKVSTVGLAATPDGFLATYSVDYSAVKAELLRCASRVAVGPPTAIAPAK